MANASKLTKAESITLRRMGLSLREWNRALDSLHERGLRNASGITDLGRAALAVYDAEQRHKVRIEAMRECLDLVVELQRSGPAEADDLQLLECQIRRLIAKEEADG